MENNSRQTLTLIPHWTITILGDNLKILNALRNNKTFLDNYQATRIKVSDDPTGNAVSATITICNSSELIQFCQLVATLPSETIINLYCNAKTKCKSAVVTLRLSTDNSHYSRDNELALDITHLDFTDKDKLNRIQAILSE